MREGGLAQRVAELEAEAAVRSRMELERLRETMAKMEGRRELERIRGGSDNPCHQNPSQFSHPPPPHPQEQQVIIIEEESDDDESSSNSSEFSDSSSRLSPLLLLPVHHPLAEQIVTHSSLAGATPTHSLHLIDSAANNTLKTIIRDCLLNPQQAASANQKNPSSSSSSSRDRSEDRIYLSMAILQLEKAQQKMGQLLSPQDAMQIRREILDVDHEKPVTLEDIIGKKEAQKKTPEEIRAEEEEHLIGLMGMENEELFSNLLRTVKYLHKNHIPFRLPEEIANRIPPSLLEPQPPPQNPSDVNVDRSVLEQLLHSRNEDILSLKKVIDGVNQGGTLTSPLILLLLLLTRSSSLLLLPLLLLLLHSLLILSFLQFVQTGNSHNKQKTCFENGHS